ncbi:inositol-polyphosphate 5-phosphatase [Schizosaccharomyces japonicus yFS275]|uniref:phosphoinositide 5-phosphatase n=1 Tax=Schizosaccharomyces japonicus (strain yFS275 / FY16936) TaxID=402676 RepID=B6K741_SCHJY|nr:inositol-polyphosphate 5-phosphatase [Schizosaccharomyces japonicus yFS275]EEB09345.1 inositol-polyphosphate 5-phosphatase [Schizosaccharomyces japonicus yFS275]
MNSLQCYIKQSPRTVAFQKDESILTIRLQEDTTDPYVYDIGLVSLEEFQKDNAYVPLFNGNNVISILNILVWPAVEEQGNEKTTLANIAICVLREAETVASIRKESDILRVKRIDFISLNSDCWDNNLFSEKPDESSTENVELNSSTESSSTSVTESSSEDATFDYEIGLPELLTDGSFYVTQKEGCYAEFAVSTEELNLKDPSNKCQFLWNGCFVKNVKKFIMDRYHLPSLADMFTYSFRGYVESEKVNDVTLTIISRLRIVPNRPTYPPSGLDDEANVCAFSEIETIVQHENQIGSFCQVRGTVPCFWQQTSTWSGKATLITRSLQAGLKSFTLHFEKLLAQYQKVYIIDLLGSAAHEVTLSDAYRRYLQQAFSTTSSIEAAHLRNDERNLADRAFLEQRFSELLSHQTYSLVTYGNKPEVLLQQKGVIRMNSYDCLGRTNGVQSVLSQLQVTEMLRTMHVNYTNAVFDLHNRLWANTGDELSKLLNGVGSIGSSAVRYGKLSFAGALSDISKSLGRMYVGMFPDDTTQENLNMLCETPNDNLITLNNSLQYFLRKSLQKAEKEHSQEIPLSLYCVTFNANGKIPDPASLEKLVCPLPGIVCDVYAVAVQELVDLKVKQLLNTDFQRLRIWEESILKTLNTTDSDETYSLVQSVQMAGISLSIYMKERLFPRVSQVEEAVRKTGFGGFSTNKGAVALRFHVGMSELCIVSSHLAPKERNIAERNSEYFDIAKNLRFLSSKRIYDNKQIVWMGDFNYRINLDYATTKKLALNGDFDYLYRYDQLQNAMREDHIFHGLTESQLTFPPTYKFDVGTSNYCPEKKQRTPSWTDRILITDNMSRLVYSSIDIQTSDHRPVFSILEFKASMLENKHYWQALREAEAEYNNTTQTDNSV